MCGIAGVIGRIGDANRAAVRRMCARMAHRGPDGEGYWESDPGPGGWGPMLGHRRLAILDLSPAGAQPMRDPVTGHVLVTNSEIYNFVTLRQELESAGHTLASSGDAAVQLRMLAVHGEAAVPRMRGMFAFACWSPRERTLLLARDPLGMKPLYVARNPDHRGEWSVAFASELRALLASGLLGRPSLAPAAVASVVWNGFVVGPTTAVASVTSLAPGTLMVLRETGEELSARPYGSPGGPGGDGSADEADIERALEETVRLHLASDVPLAVFLSGGVDSTAVANLARRVSEAPVHTFTLAFEEQELDEAPFARRAAEAMGTVHTEVVLSEGRFLRDLDAGLDGLDQPTFDGLNAHFMSRAVRDAGFVVALVGTGGDELFGGYASFRDLPRLARWAQRTRWIPPGVRAALARELASALAPGSAGVPSQARWAKLPAMLERADDLVALYQLAYALFLPDFQRELLADDCGNALVDGLPSVVRDELARATRPRTSLSALGAMEQRVFLAERLLRDGDAASMAASVEQRLPLVDQAFFETVDRLEDPMRFHPVGRKAILRRVGLRGLPPRLFDRPKSGFVLPFDRWIRAGLGSAVKDTLLDTELLSRVGLAPQAVRRLWDAFNVPGSRVYWSRVWALFVLARWCQGNGVYL